MTSVMIHIKGGFVYLENGTVTHLEKEYQLSAILLMTYHTPVATLPLEKLEWILSAQNDETLEEKENRILLADIAIPIIVFNDPKYGWVVIDGVHRLHKIKRLFDAGEHDGTVSVKVLKRLPNETEDLIGRGQFLIATSATCAEKEKCDAIWQAINALDQTNPYFR